LALAKVFSSEKAGGAVWAGATDRPALGRDDWGYFYLTGLGPVAKGSHCGRKKTNEVGKFHLWLAKA
jgi:hypothetical protein